MIAVCTLCGAVIEAKPDPVMDDQRDDRTLGRLGGTFKAHVQKHHANPATADESLGEILSNVVIAAGSLALFSFVETADPVFQEKMSQMRDILAKGIEPKPMTRPASQIQPG